MVSLSFLIDFGFVERKLLMVPMRWWNGEDDEIKQRFLLGAPGGIKSKRK